MATYSFQIDGSSRESRVATLQKYRLIAIGVLTLMSLVEWCVVMLSYYMTVPVWLVVVNIVCVFFNVPLIWWLSSLWLDVRKREKAIQKRSWRA